MSNFRITLEDNGTNSFDIALKNVAESKFDIFLRDNGLVSFDLQLSTTMNAALAFSGNLLITGQLRIQ